MTEQIENILSSVRRQLSVELPDYATISMQLGLFESTHTAKQSEEAPVPPQVRLLFSSEARDSFYAILSAWLTFQAHSNAAFSRMIYKLARPPLTHLLSS